jgi:hypothetical protein
MMNVYDDRIVKQEFVAREGCYISSGKDRVPVTFFLKMCCGRPTQTMRGKPYCPACQGR